MTPQEFTMKILAGDKEAIRELKSLNYRRANPQFWQQLKLDFENSWIQTGRNSNATPK